MAKRAAVLGWPVEHSLSPKLHNYWIKQYGIDGEYGRLAVQPEALGETLKSLPGQGYCGVNLTIPHKEQALDFLDDVDDLARSIGAVNTIVVRNGKLHGTNTDAYGFMTNLKHFAPSLRTGTAVVLGAGGAARAVCQALRDEGFSRVIIANRTLEKAQELAKQFGVVAEDWDKRSDLLAQADLLVNTTSLGLAGKDPLDIDLSAMPAHAVVNDIVYTPLITPLLAQAKARRLVAVDGLGMLIYQAVPAFKLWFGVEPQPDESLKDFLLEGR